MNATSAGSLPGLYPVNTDVADSVELLLDAGEQTGVGSVDVRELRGGRDWPRSGDGGGRRRSIMQRRRACRGRCEGGGGRGISPGRVGLVGAPGFEPGTSTSQTWRATKLRYAPREGLLSTCSAYPWVEARVKEREAVCPGAKRALEFERGQALRSGLLTGIDAPRILADADNVHT